GQVGVHVGPNVVHGGYRYDVMRLADGLGLSIEPMIGTSYYRVINTPNNPMDPVQKLSAVAFMVGIVPTLLLPMGNGFAYLTPKLGFQINKDLDAMPGQNSTLSTYVVGASLGIDIGDGISFELAVHYVDNADSRNPDPPGAWLFVPTLGVRH